MRLSNKSLKMKITPARCTYDGVKSLKLDLLDSPFLFLRKSISQQMFHRLVDLRVLK